MLRFTAAALARARGSFGPIGTATFGKVSNKEQASLMPARQATGHYAPNKTLVPKRVQPSSRSQHVPTTTVLELPPEELTTFSETHTALVGEQQSPASYKSLLSKRTSAASCVISSSTNGLSQLPPPAAGCEWQQVGVVYEQKPLNNGSVLDVTEEANRLERARTPTTQEDLAQPQEAQRVFTWQDLLRALREAAWNVATLNLSHEGGIPAVGSTTPQITAGYPALEAGGDRTRSR